jgi:hypothetical protein
VRGWNGKNRLDPIGLTQRSLLEHFEQRSPLLINGLGRGVEIKLGDRMIRGDLVVVDGLAIRDIRRNRCSEPSRAGC